MVSSPITRQQQAHAVEVLGRVLPGQEGQAKGRKKRNGIVESAQRPHQQFGFAEKRTFGIHGAVE